MIIMTMIMIIGNDYYLIMIMIMIMIIVVMCIYIYICIHIYIYIYLLGLPYALRPCTHVETRNRICIWVIWGGVGVGLGWGWGGVEVITFMSTWTHMDCMVYVWVGWGGGNNVHASLNTHGLHGVQMRVGLGWGRMGVITFMSTWTHIVCMVCYGGGVGVGWG